MTQNQLDILTDPRILHVDDEDDVRENVKEFLEGENVPDWGRPEVVGTGDFDEALRLLEAERFDLVILDVRRGSRDEGISVEQEAGVGTLAAIKARRFVPIVFWTGLPGNVDPEPPLITVGEKTEGLPVLTDLVRSAFATRLPALNRALRRMVEDEQRRYMWDFVSKHWETLHEVGDHTAVAYLLARRLARSISGQGIVAMAHALGENVEALVPSGDIHPVEIYLLPPLGDQELLAGDILEGCTGGRDGWWLTLTPSCDLVNEKAEFVLLAVADPLPDHAFFQRWIAAEPGKDKSAMQRVEGLIRQKSGGQDDRWLYLPAALSVPHLVVDMQRLVSIPCAEAKALRQVASLDSPFAEEAVNRFNRYYGRIGTPNFDPAPLMSGLAAVINERRVPTPRTDELGEKRPDANA
jgi:CheY-like chemotaxis protein